MMQYVSQIQKNDLSNFPLLLEMFHPLIYAWLRKIHHLSTFEKEDYYSMAKVILLECAKNYAPEKHVPFESYYKISLYHWYGNQLKKKQLTTSSLENSMPPIETSDLVSELERKNNLDRLKRELVSLNPQEQIIFTKLMNGQSPNEIARSLSLSRKTILNKKYIIIQKLKKSILTEKVM